MKERTSWQHIKTTARMWRGALLVSFFILLSGCGQSSANGGVVHVPTPAHDATTSPGGKVTALPIATVNGTATPPGQKIASIHMLDTSTGWAVTTALAVLRTIDGGISWKDVSPKTIPKQVDSNIVANFLSASNAWVGISPFSTPPMQVFRTANGGQTWQLSTAPSDNLGQISFINAQNGWMLAGLQATVGPQAVEVLRTTDGGATWIKVSSVSPTHASPNALPPGATGLSFINTSTGWGTGTTPASTVFLYVTHDGGSDWRKQTLPLPPNLEGITINTEPPTFFSDRDGILPISVPASNSLPPSFYVYVTHDAGASWMNPALLSASINTSDFIDMNHGWAADSNGQCLYATGDGARHWSKIATITGFDSIASLDFVSTQVGWMIGYKSTDIAYTTTLLKTVDGGRTWMPVTFTVS